MLTKLLAKRNQYLVAAASLLTISLFLTGCNSETATQSQSTEKGFMKNPDLTSTFESRAKEEDVKPSTQQNRSLAPDDQTQKKMTYQATLTLQVDNFQQANKQVEHLSHNMKGYILNSEQFLQDREITSTVVCRIPQENFHSFLEQLEELATEVPVKKISGNDVTEEYIDLASRLRAKEAVEKRLLSLMKQAKKTEDLIQISKELGNVQEEMEQLKGKIRYLDNQVTYSTVTLHIQQWNGKDHITKKPPVGSEMKRSFFSSLDWLQALGRDIVIAIAASLPPLMLLALLGLPILLGYRFRRHQRKIKPAQGEADDPSNKKEE